MLISSSEATTCPLELEVGQVGHHLMQHCLGSFVVVAVLVAIVLDILLQREGTEFFLQIAEMVVADAVDGWYGEVFLSKEFREVVEREVLTCRLAGHSIHGTSILSCDDEILTAAASASEQMLDLSWRVARHPTVQLF